jgi:hypothetical protein
MAVTLWGIVKDGLIVPPTPLPEGARVQIVLPDPSPDIPPELQEEFDAWDRASANALELVERLAREGDQHEAR